MNPVSRTIPSRPHLESLEPRLTPSATISTKGNLYIQGTTGADTVVVQKVTLEGVDYHQVTEGTVVTKFKTADVTGGYVYFYGFGGDDRFESTTPLLAVAFGGEGNDYLSSDYGGYLDGEAGNDTISAGAGPIENALTGGDGNDLILGSPNRDLMYGDAGNDTLTGGGGDDYLEGNDGNDSLDGGTGDDVIHGQLGNDTLFGGAGNDQLVTGNGSDRAFGGAGDDIIWAGDDRATNFLYGGDGNDAIFGGAGIDFLYGENGSDRLVGGDGNDRLYGGGGLDYLWGERGNDYLDGGKDSLADYLDGGAGRDYFRREVYWTGTSWRHRERMPDFSSTQDEFFV